jgi:hypothetical protein
MFTSLPAEKNGCQSSTEYQRASISLEYSPNTKNEIDCEISDEIITLVLLQRRSDEN